MKDISKKLIKIIIFIIILIAVIVLISFIASKFKSYNYTYSELENEMLQAARQYSSSNQGVLPVMDGTNLDVDVNTLVSNGYMKEMSKYIKDKTVSCSGKVTITKSGNYYYYAPYLSCGDKYTTSLLVDKILDNLVSEGDGLYAMDQYFEGKMQKSYIFRGEYPNNYISINGKMWRVVKVNPDGTITIMMDFTNKDIFEKESWDDRYNISIDNRYGINDFEASRLKQRLDYYYSYSLSTTVKERLVSKKLCIGTRSIHDSKNDGSIECSKYSEEPMYLSLLPMYDYMNVSLDSNCKLPEDRSCMNYNYMNQYNLTWWLLTTNSKATYRGYTVYGNISRVNLSSNAYDRLVAVLNSNIVYAGGNGTYNNPYLIK